MNMGEKDLTKNLDFVQKNRSQLLQTYRNKFLLVYDGEVVGSFDSYESAANEGVRIYGTESPFLVSPILEKEPMNFIMEAAL